MSVLLRHACWILLCLGIAPAHANDERYARTIEIFKAAGESSDFFGKAHGYAVFPTVGKGGIGIGGAHGKGRVYEQGRYIGDTTLTQISVGLQLGGQAFSQIIFFEDKRSLEEFTGGNFEFAAQASAIAVTASASAQTSTTGTSAGLSGGQRDASTVGSLWYKGMAVFTVAKGGLMYEAAIGGQKFSFTRR